MSPYQIEVVLHYAARESDHPDVATHPPIWRPTIQRLIDEELIEVAGPSAGRAYQLSARGAVYVNALVGTPLPVRTWAMPKERD